MENAYKDWNGIETKCLNQYYNPSAAIYQISLSWDETKSFY